MTPVGVLDSNHSSDGWHPGFQVSDNERPEYSALITGFEIGIRRVHPNEIRFYEAKLKLQQFTGIKGPIRKI
jgi:hypothetical protein